ncbi:acyltransferase domain-containing protein, partial [Nocardiopsis aegyptia]|uniref:acyltransferase domain-containing protein n=1 Tax=Nocardiopsis aegyptia TaxID=220378 RepID=UPI00367346D8
MAGVNGPESVVVSGDADAVGEVAELWRGRGRRVKRLVVSHAFHSAHMDGVLAEFRTIVAGLEFGAPTVPVVSNVTGVEATREQLSSPDYWAEHVRGAVRFMDGVRFLESQGVTDFVELGPDGVLSALVPGCLVGDGAGSLVPLLRRGRSEAASVAGALGEFFVRGVEVDWERVFAGGSRVDLPTYAFERRRFWLGERHRQADTAALGLSATGHPLLGAGVEVAGGGEVLFTGRLSLRTHPWLADYLVSGRVVVPGAVLVESVVRAGDEFGASVLEELTVTEPLVLPEQGGVLVQVRVGEADEAGSRPVTVHSRAESRDSTDWTLTARGVLGGGTGAWTPLEGESTAIRLTEDLEPDAAGYGIHPVLLDSAVHAFAPDTAAGTVAVPTRWTDVRLHAAGATAARVTSAPVGEDSVRIDLVDEDDGLVAGIGSLTWEAVPEERLLPGHVPGGGMLARVDQVPFTGTGRAGRRTWAAVGGRVPGAEDHPDLAAVARAARDGDPVDAVLVRWAGEDRGDPVATVHHEIARAQGLVREFLSHEPLDGTRMVVCFEPAAGTESAADLASASVRGLLRSAQAESPGRLLLVDTDTAAPDLDLVSALLDSGETEAAVRADGAVVPRLRRVRTDSASGSGFGGGTVVVTGATGVLGGVVARHVVAEH